MAQLQLYMWHGTRAYLLERHRFYVAQVKARLLSQFSDIEGEAESHEKEVWETLILRPSNGENDLSEIADLAQDAGVGHYMNYESRCC